MSAKVFVRTWRAQRAKLLAVAVGLLIWGSLMPIIFEAFKEQIKIIVGSGAIPAQLTQFGGGDLFTLPGTIALGFIHPIAVAMTLVFALGFAVASVAGERQRGTLEVLLARPLSRRRLYLTLLGATILFVAAAMAAQVVGTCIGAALAGALDELRPDRLGLMWLNGVLVFAAFGSVSLAASVSFDRLSPALAASLAFVLVSYFLEILGSLWIDARGLQPYSLFHYLDPKGALNGSMTAGDWLVPLGVFAAGFVVSMVVFPRRDLAAPA
ncbi:MAG: ABC transporter permease subunit [Candidatus Limnocylindrales bacterium]